jgi:hypothetical protein
VRIRSNIRPILRRFYFCIPMPKLQAIGDFDIGNLAILTIAIFASYAIFKDKILLGIRHYRHRGGDMSSRQKSFLRGVFILMPHLVPLIFKQPFHKVNEKLFFPPKKTPLPLALPLTALKMLVSTKTKYMTTLCGNDLMALLPQKIRPKAHFLSNL